SLERRQETLRAQRASLAAGLVVAHRSLQIAQRRVARQLRYLYEAGAVSPAEIVLGARTLGDAVTNIDRPNPTTPARPALVEELKGARIQLVHEQHALAVRAAALAAARARAAATEAELARTRAARAAHIASLAREQRVTVQAQARDAVVRTARLRSTRSIA